MCGIDALVWVFESAPGRKQECLRVKVLDCRELVAFKTTKAMAAPFHGRVSESVGHNTHARKLACMGQDSLLRVLAN